MEKEVVVEEEEKNISVSGIQTNSCSMAASYADLLSYRPIGKLGGGLGLKETPSTQSIIECQAEELTEKIRTAVREKKSIVVFTGAGISVASGIQDFRGPNGIWTCQAQGRIPPLEKHMAIAALVNAGIVNYVVSQNVDGLHLRSGLDLSELSEVHGNIFREHCPKCKHVFVRDFDIAQVGLKATGRICGRDGCKGRLRDSCLDWDSKLPEESFSKAIEQSKSAALVITMGTSLRVIPICDVPETVKDNEGELVIINLQETPKDRIADLVIRAKVDDVMKIVMRKLDMSVHAWRRNDMVGFSYRLSDPNESTKKRKRSGRLIMRVIVHGGQGEDCVVPWANQIKVTFAPDSLNIRKASRSSCSRLEFSRELDENVTEITARVTLDIGELWRPPDGLCKSITQRKMEVPIRCDLPGKTTYETFIGDEIDYLQS